MRRDQTIVPSDEQVSDFASRLREYMKISNLRQADIAELCLPFCKEYGIQIPSNAISQYIQGKAQPNPNRLRIISKALGVSEIWLLGYNVPLRITEAITEHQYVLTDNIEYDFTFEMPDDSMIRTQILAGDIVFCKSKRSISYGNIAAVVIEDKTTLREYNYIYADNNRISLLSPSNPSYGITVYNGDSTGVTQILGEAVAIVGRISSRNTQSHLIL